MNPIGRLTVSMAALMWSALAAWAASPGWKEIGCEELRGMLQGRDLPILINTMSKLECLDHRIVGSVCLPAERIESGAEGLPGDKGKAIVFYCESDRCFRSKLAAEKAGKLGYSNVFVLKRGLPGWKETGYDTESIVRIPRAQVPSIKAKQLRAWQKEGKEILVVDVRTETLFTKDHIQGAMNLPMYLLEERQGDLPKEKDILVVDETGYNSLIAASFLVSKGFGRIHRLFGGMEDWRASESGGAKRVR